MREEGTTRPSSRAVERLADDVGGEIADLRTALRQALTEADRHESEGRPDRAAAVLAEQQQLLAVVHRRLEARLADAAVEREAEGVVDAVAPTRFMPVVSDPRATGDVPDHDGGTALRLLASAAAALVGVALLLAPDSGGMLQAADSAGIEEGVRSDGQDSAHGAADPDAAATARSQPQPRPSHDPPPSPDGERAVPEADDVRSGPSPADPDGEDEVGPADRLQSGLATEVREVLDRIDDVPAVEQGTDTGGDADTGDSDTDDDQDAEQSEPSDRSWQPGDLTREDDESADPER